MKPKEVNNLIATKILDEIKNNGGKITTKEFNKIAYKTRLTEYEVINGLYNIKADKDRVISMMHLIRISKSDIKDIKSLLVDSGCINMNKRYITIKP